MTLSGYGYSERLAWPFWLHLVLGACFGLLVYGGVGLWPDVGSMLFLAITGALVLYGWWRIRHFNVRIEASGVAFGFGSTLRHVPFERIRSLEEVEYSAARYMGWGYRIGWKPRERACSIIGYPRGLRIVFDDERGRVWEYFLSCGDPKAALAAAAAGKP